jgi:hypothetical protein
MMDGMRLLFPPLRWKYFRPSDAKGQRHKRRYAVFFVTTIAFCFFISTVHSGEAIRSTEVALGFAAPPGMFLVGEELIYEVSYSFFSLGTVKLQILDTIAKEGATLYQAKAFMDSYSGVPFVDLHYVFYSEIDPAYYSRFFSGLNTNDPKNTWYSDYVFDYSQNRVLTEKGIRQFSEKSVKGMDTISSFYQDGLSLLYFARGNVHSKSVTNAPTYVNEKKVNTLINFMNKKTSSEISAVNYPIRTVELDGRAEFVGVFGLTGGFSGWFSDDDAAVPIVAKMKVIIGSVRLELKRWNRPGWVPPRALEE